MAEVLTRPSGTRTSSLATDESQTRWIVETLSGATSDSLVDASWRQRRQINCHEAETLRIGHEEHYTARLERARAAHGRRGTAELLTDLSERWGMTWVDIARIVGVSVPAVRKWRISATGASPENHARLASLAGFLEVLSEMLSGATPAAWLAMPLQEGYSVTPRHVYNEKSAAALLDYAADNSTALDLLDRTDPDWRRTYRSEYEVFVEDDGQAGLRRRGGN